MASNRSPPKTPQSQRSVFTAEEVVELVEGEDEEVKANDQTKEEKEVSSGDFQVETEDEEEKEVENAERLSDSEEKFQSEMVEDDEEKGSSHPDPDPTPSSVVTRLPLEVIEKEQVPTSPRASALFGRLLSAMRNELSPPTSPLKSSVEVKQPSLIVAESTEIFAEKIENEHLETLDKVESCDIEVEKASVENGQEEETVYSGGEMDTQPSVEEAVEAGSESTNSVSEVSEDQALQNHSEVDSQANSVLVNDIAVKNSDSPDKASVSSHEDEETAAGNPQNSSLSLQTEVSKPVISPPTSSSRLFGRLMSAMRNESPVPTVEAETRRPSTSNSITGDNNVPASTSIFDRLISTVRQETPATTAVPSPTVNESVINDSVEKPEISNLNIELETALNDEIPPETMTIEATAIEEMVELTLDFSGEQEEMYDTEPSLAYENETIAENHESEPSVTNEIDHFEENYPVELQTAIQRAGAAMLNVLPSPESSGISTECFKAVESMKNEGELISMNFINELETAGVLVTCANTDDTQSLKASEDHLAELRAAVAACCTGRLAWFAIPELLALWSVVHTSISDGISDEIGEKANVMEPFEIARAAERQGSILQTLATAESEKDKIEVDNSLYDEHLAHAALNHAMSGLKGSLLLSRQRLTTTLQAMREGRAALVGGCLTLVNIPPLLRLEIARDFFQTAGLFLSGMFKPTLKYFDDYNMPPYVSILVKGLRAAYTIVAIDVSAFIQWISKSSDIGVFISIGVVIFAHIFFIGWLYKITRYMPRGADNVRHGHESTTWATLATTNKRMAMISSFLITASLTAYLPLTQFCFTVLDIDAHKHDDTPNNQGTVALHFREKSYWGLIVFEALALLLTFSIPLPFVLISSIRANRPRGSLENAKVTYDLDGEQVPFDDKVYARLVASDPSQLRCPYRSLYNGFEQRWSTYKVLQLVAKAVLAAVVIAAGRNVSTGGVIVCGVYFAIVVLTSYSRPFIDPVNDLMENCAKFTVLVTAVGGTAGAFAQQYDIHSTYLEIFLAFVLFVHFMNLWIMLTVTLLGVTNTRTLIKNWLGWLSFSDTTRMIDDARAQDILPHWDLNKEAKHRVWQAFWRAVLYDLTDNEVDTSQHSDDQIKNAPAAARLINLDQSVVTAGIRRVSSHWRGKQQRYTTRLRQVVRTALEGVDVYWNEDTGVRDGHLDSQTFFGKMYVVPYPFHCVIVYDNTNDEAILWDEVDESAPRDNKLHSNLAKLLFLNFSPKIVAKRELRQKIRALADAKTPVRFPFSRVEKAVVTDYYIWTPLEGGNPMKIHYKAVVDFTCHYTYGVFKVQTSGDSAIKKGEKRAMADGFIVTLTYKDGRGYAKAPRTGKRFEVTGRKVVCDSDHFGLNPDMEENEHLKLIFEQTRSSWELGIKKMKTEHREYRRKLIQIHADANAVLSDDFWYFVYNNQYLSRNDLEQYLATREVNPLLCQLPETHKVALDALYLRQRFIMLSPAHKLWYIFWDDVYARNSEMSSLIPKGEPQPDRACKNDFDPNSASSICYKKMNRADLELWLADRKLLSKTGMFHSALLHLLYEQMKKLDEGGDPKNMMKIRPGGRSFKRRSMITSMLWRPTA